MLDVVSSAIQVISYGYVVVQLKGKKINITNIKNILLMLIIFVSSYLTGVYNTGFAKTIVFYSIFTVCFKYIFSIETKESAIINFFAVLQHFVSELLFVSIITLIGIDSNILQEYLYLTPLSGLLIFLMVIILNHFCKSKLKKIISTLMYSLPNNIFYVIIIISLSIVFSININNWRDKNLLSNLLIAGMFGIIIILWISEKLKVSLANKNFNQLFEQSSILLSKYKKINHENKNDFRALKSIAKNNQDVQEYIKEILLEKNIVDNDKSIEEISKINDMRLVEFLSLKLNEIIDNHIKLFANVSDKITSYDFTKLNTKEYKDLCRILGIYLDNAYQASIESIEKEVTFEMFMIEDNVQIIISNSFSGEVDLNKLGKEGYTTKGNEHGSGLSIVRDIVSKNKFITMKTSIIDNFFYQYLYLEILNKKNT